MSRLSVGLLSSASYARGFLSVKIACGKARPCTTVPGDQGNVETRPKQPPSTLRQARGQSRRCLPRFLLTFLSPYLLFSRRFLRHDSTLSAIDRRRERYMSVLCSSPFVPRELFSIRRLMLSSFVSIVSAFPSTVTRFERRSLSDPSIYSAWQSTTAIHCRSSTSIPRSVYNVTAVSTNAS